ncbi:MAG: tetratricopeptide repeat protein [Spirosomataceae bacterium]
MKLLKRIYLGLTIALLLSEPAFSQKVTIPNSIDSLVTFLKTYPKQDSIYNRALNRLTRKYIYEKADYRGADSLAKLSETLAKKIGWNLGLVTAYVHQATVPFLQDNPEQAAVFFKKALATAEAARLEQEVIANYGNLAVAYDRMEKWDLAMDYAMKGINYQESHHFKTRFSNLYATVGKALKRMGRPKEALPYYLEAIKADQESNNQRNLAVSYNLTGNIYDDLGQLQTALSYYKKSLSLAESIKFELLQADALDNIGRMYTKLKRPAEALPYFEKCLRIGQKQNNQETTATAYNSLGNVYKNLNKPKEAEEYLKLAVSIAQKEEFTEDLKHYTKDLADFYKENQQYKLAYEQQLNLNRLRDSVQSSVQSKEVKELIAKFESEKKEQQIKLLHQEAQLKEQSLAEAKQREQFYWIAGIGLVVLMVLGWAWLQNRNRLKRLEENQAIRKKIAQDLHDEVGSTLSSISLLSGLTDKLLDEKRPESAQRMVKKIYQDARTILDSIDEIIWTINPSNDTLRRIAFRLQEYAQPLMESKNIDFSVEIQPDIDELPISMEVRRNLYLIGKEAINNSVKHSEAQSAKLKFERQNKTLKITIIDNGKGFDTATPTTRNGQQSMKQRAELIGGSLNLQTAPGEGTQLELLVEC